MTPISLFWHRRDLRTHDNRGLSAALQSKYLVAGFFCFDRTILDALPTLDARVGFIHTELTRVQAEYDAAGSQLISRYGVPLEELQALREDLRSAGYDLKEIQTNRDYAPYPVQRDEAVAEWCATSNIRFVLHEDHVILPPEAVLKDDGTPYTVFTPYSRKWKKVLEAAEVDPMAEAFVAWNGRGAQPFEEAPWPSLNSMGFDPESANPEGWAAFEGRTPDSDTLHRYADRRDTPSVVGTARMSLHLRFGTVSVRSQARLGFAHSEKWLTELIWREFYQAILHHFPHSARDAFRAKYDRIPWRHDDAHYAAWCAGKTGYPLVDAGMRELNSTGFMHNRVRMVVASFLCKHLLLDWRLGERYFAEKLLDFELASNVGGWQWASGSGCDAAPYFRVFNPESQMKKFDPSGTYVRRWVPEWGTPAYPEPIVEHKFARQRAIDTYKAALADA